MSNPYIDIPLPPVTGPYPTPSTAIAPPGYLYYVAYFWNPASNHWDQNTVLQAPWDAYPFGYYHTPIDWPGVPVVTVVLARTADDGSVQPNVLWDPATSGWVRLGPDSFPPPPPPVDPTQGQPQSPNCAPGYFFIPYSDAIGSSDSPIQQPFINNDPANPTPSGMCVPIFLTIPPLTPPPRLPPPPTCPPGQYWDVVTGTCKPIPKPPPPPPTCPPGTVWDPVTKTCIPIPVPPPPTCPPTVPTPCQPSTNPTDELGQGLNCITQNLLYLQWQLSQLQLGVTGQPSNPDPVTCTQLSGLLNATNAWLYVISQAITKVGTGGSTPVDLTAIVNALNAIATAESTDLAPLVAAITGSGVLVNPTPPIAPVFVQPPTYTVAQASTDIESAKDLLPNGAQVQP
jgi:hypothetical protein